MAEGGDIYSLEEEECSQMFITQEPKDSIKDLLEKSGENEVQMETSLFGIPGNDFGALCVSMVDVNQNVYSDISNDDFTNEPVKKAQFE